jgi:hypothetical protein
MTEAHFNVLLVRAKEIWKRMETYRVAYHERSTVFTRNAEWLKWMTIGAGFATGVGSLAIFTETTSVAFAGFTGIAGVITGSLGMCDKLFHWEERSNDLWVRSKSLENLQSELYQFVIEASVSNLSEEPGFFLERVIEKYKQDSSCKIQDLGRAEQQAAQSLVVHGLSSLEFAGDEKPVPASVPEAQAEDTEGITVATRGI